MKNYKTIIIFFGPPGSGKGTQAKILSKKIKLPVISPGELFRREQENKTEIGKLIAENMAKGELVPDKIVEEIIGKRLLMKDAKKGFMLDGYPRRKSQLKMLKKKFKEIVNSQDKVKAIYIDTSDKNVIEHISGRRVCGCGASYHIKTKPPKKSGVCDICGLKLRQRKDDSPEVAKNRLKKFHKRIKPLMNYFKDNYVLYVVNGNKSIKEVGEEIQQKLKL